VNPEEEKGRAGIDLQNKESFKPGMRK